MVWTLDSVSVSDPALVVSGGTPILHDVSALSKLISTMIAQDGGSVSARSATFQGNALTPVGSIGAITSRHIWSAYRIGEYAAAEDQPVVANWTGNQGAILNAVYRATGTPQLISSTTRETETGGTPGTATSLSATVDTQPGDLVLLKSNFNNKTPASITSASAPNNATLLVSVDAGAAHQQWARIATTESTTVTLNCGSATQGAMIVEVWREAITLTAEYGDSDVAYGSDPGFAPVSVELVTADDARSTPLSFGASSTDNAPTFNIADVLTLMAACDFVPAFGGLQLKIVLTGAGAETSERDITITIPAAFDALQFVQAATVDTADLEAADGSPALAVGHYIAADTLSTPGGYAVTVGDDLRASIDAADPDGESFSWRAFHTDSTQDWGDAGVYTFDAIAIDETSPVLQSASINAAGSALTLTFGEAVEAGADGFSGLTISLSGGAAVLTYSSGIGSASVEMSLGRTVQLGEIATLDYVQPGDGLQDASGNLLAGFVGEAVTNNSSVELDSVAPVITLLVSSTLFLNLDDPYEVPEPGETATALDDVDGDITASITIESNVDTSVPGAYAETYSVSDAAGNPAIPRVRSVLVIASSLGQGAGPRRQGHFTYRDGRYMQIG